MRVVYWNSRDKGTSFLGAMMGFGFSMMLIPGCFDWLWTPIAVILGSAMLIGFDILYRNFQ